jgi:hypothetical protein
MKLYFGWDFYRSPLNHFEFSNGTMSYRSSDSNYGLYSTKPDLAVELVPGVSLSDTLMVPWGRLPKEGREAYKRMGDIMTYIQERHPKTRFMLYTAMDQMHCSDGCLDRIVRQPDGATIKIGVETLLQNIGRTCDYYGIECVDVAFPPRADNPAEKLFLFGDEHYNKRGHQWLAQQLSVLLSPKIAGGKRRE